MDIKCFITPDWFVAFGMLASTVVALYLGIDGIKKANIAIRRQNKQDSIGLTLKKIGPDGVGVIENNSRMDYEIELSRYVLADGTDNELSEGIQKEFNRNNKRDEKKLKILRRIIKLEPEALLPKQVLSPNEAISFHIYDLSKENVSVAFILLKLSTNRKEKFYLYRFAYRPNIGKISSPLKDTFNPHECWFKMYSFEK